MDNTHLNGRKFRRNFPAARLRRPVKVVVSPRVGLGLHLHPYQRRGHVPRTSQPSWREVQYVLVAKLRLAGYT